MNGTHHAKRSAAFALGFFAAAAVALPSARAAEPVRELIPVGQTIGVKLFSDGVLVIGFSDGESPAKDCGLKEGDVITAVGGRELDTIEEFRRLLSENGEYRLGAWVRDSMAGIGTMTFYDPQSGVFGALGHGVTGLSGTQPLATTGGILVPSVVSGVKKGVRGTPGELHGSFDVSTTLGSVSQNETHGIFGTLNAAPAHEAVPVADSAQVRTGAATILANVDGTDVTEYSVRIERLYPQAENGRNLLITVTDERLLEKTGGIVQGMSGSPILQDGRLVGAVTHVLVNHPEQGYGIFMQTMLSQCSAYQ